jgi:hypothetical protein
MIADCPEPCKVCRTTEGTLPAQYAYVGIAQMPDRTIRKFWIAADDNPLMLLAQPEQGIDRGPVVGFMAKVVPQTGEVRCGWCDDRLVLSTQQDVEAFSPEARKHAIRVHQHDLDVWIKAGILRFAAEKKIGVL